MQASTKSTDIKSYNNFIQFLKALLIALIITLTGIILFAFIIKMTNLSDKFIVPINLVIKGLSVIFGTIIWTKNKQGGLKKGILFAIIYTTLAYIVFSALSNSFSFSLSLVLDYIFLIVVGAIIGVLRVNVKK